MASIFHLITNYEGRGGAERSLTAVLAGLKSHDHIISSLHRLNPRLYEDIGEFDQIRIGPELRCRKNVLMVLIAPLRLLYEILKTRPAVAVGWMYHANLMIALLKLVLFLKLRIVWNIRHSLDNPATDSFGTRIARRICAALSHIPDEIIYNSERSKMQHEAAGFCALRSHYVPNGVDITRFSPRVDNSVDPTKILQIGTLGRIHPVKNQYGLIRAIANTKLNKISLRIKGKDATRLHLSTSEYDVSTISLLEEDDDAPEKYLKQLDLFVLPSLSEGFPNALAEAMACGIPCITTDVGEAANIVGDAGIVVPAGSDELLAEAICEMVDRIRNGNVARKKCVERIHSLFSAEVCIQRFEAILLNLKK